MVTVPIGYTLRKGARTHIRAGNGRAVCGTELPAGLRGYDGPISQVGCCLCRRLYHAETAEEWSRRVVDTPEKAAVLCQLLGIPDE